MRGSTAPDGVKFTPLIQLPVLENGFQSLLVHCIIVSRRMCVSCILYRSSPACLIALYPSYFLLSFRVARIEISSTVYNL